MCDYSGANGFTIRHRFDVETRRLHVLSTEFEEWVKLSDDRKPDAFINANQAPWADSAVRTVPAALIQSKQRIVSRRLIAAGGSEAELKDVTAAQIKAEHEKCPTKLKHVFVYITDDIVSADERKK